MEEVNLFPQDILKKRSRLRRIQAWCLTGAGVLIAVLILSGLLRNKVAGAQDRLDELTAHYKHMETLIMRTKALDAEMKELHEKEKIIDSLLRQRPWADALRTLAVSTEDEAWFTSLEMTEVLLAKDQGGQGTQADKKPGAGAQAIEVSLNGYAISNAELADFLSRLSGSVFSQVDLKLSEEGQFSDYDIVRFELEALLEQE